MFEVQSWFHEDAAASGNGEQLVSEYCAAPMPGTAVVTRERAAPDGVHSPEAICEAIGPIFFF